MQEKCPINYRNTINGQCSFITSAGFYARFLGVSLLINALHYIGSKHLMTNSKCAQQDRKATGASSRACGPSVFPLPLSSPLSSDFPRTRFVDKCQPNSALFSGSDTELSQNGLH